MKAEGSAVPVVVLHKVKVKEESRDEGCDLQQHQQQEDSSTLPSNGDNSPTCTMGKTTVCNSINRNNISCTNVMTSAVVTSITSINNSSITSSTKVGAIDSQQFCSELNAKEAFSADHESKGGSCQKIVESNEKSPNEEASKDLREKERLSPPYSETKQSGINGRLLSYACENKNSCPSHSIKPDDDELPTATKKSQDVSNSDAKSHHASTNPESRGISSVFAGHTKLKRLLGTLVQFANNISTETGDTVRNLILALLSDGLSAEEFHTALQEATNFPLRDFVLPYLKHTLPSLRKNINAAARINNQTCVQYLQSNESAVLKTVSFIPSGETVQLFNDHKGITNYGIRSSTMANSNMGSMIQQTTAYSGSLHHHYSGGLKRRAPDSLYYENGSGAEEPSIYSKRPNNSWNHQASHQLQQQHQSDPYCWYHPAHSSTSAIQTHSASGNHGSNFLFPNLVQINHSPSFGSHHISQLQLNHGSGSGQNSSSLDDEWKNIHVMLNCILGMVEKTKRALLILQKRGCSSPVAPSPLTSGLISTQNGNNNSNNNINNNCTNISQESTTATDRDSNLKRLSGEIVAQTIRATEDRVAAEVKRRAEEAVQEVKRVAMVEVQRAVAAAVAESRANERFRSHQLFDVRLSQKDQVTPRARSFLRLNNNVRDLSSREMPSKENVASVGASNLSGDDEKEGMHLSNISGSSCWNCGRPALETCGGCGIARYCSSFCQHRDWETGGHHATCRSSPSSESRRSASRSPPRIAGNVIANVNQIDMNDTNPSTINKSI